MTLSWQIQLIDDLIRENPEATIRDYLILLADIESIEQQNENDMEKVTEEERQQILQAIETMQPKDIAKKFGRSPATIYRALREAGYDLWAEKRKAAAKKWEAEQLAKIEAKRKVLNEKVSHIMETSTSPAPVRRPAPVYSNTDFYKKYAI